MRQLLWPLFGIVCASLLSSKKPSKSIQWNDYRKKWNPPFYTFTFYSVPNLPEWRKPTPSRLWTGKSEMSSQKSRREKAEKRKGLKKSFVPSPWLFEMLHLRWAMAPFWDMWRWRGKTLRRKNNSKKLNHIAKLTPWASHIDKLPSIHSKVHAWFSSCSKKLLKNTRMRTRFRVSRNCVIVFLRLSKRDKGGNFPYALREKARPLAQPLEG